MSERIVITAQKRDTVGKGSARSLRREGNIPAIVYGGNQEELRIFTDLRELVKQYERGHFTSKVVDLTIDGKIVSVLPKQIQLDPVTDTPLHIDFYRIDKDTKVRVQVGVVFINAEKSPGLKRGGVLNIVRRDVELICSPDSIPEKIIVDLDNLQIGDSVHISHVSIPTGATPTITDRDFTIATIVGRTATTAEEEEEAARKAAAAEASATADKAGAGEDKK